MSQVSILGIDIATQSFHEVAMSAFLGIFPDFGKSRRVEKLLLQKEFQYSIAAGDNCVLTGPSWRASSLTCSHIALRFAI